MNFIHADLAAGGWAKYTLMEQLGNVGSDVDRAIRWKEKNNQQYFMAAFYRAIELMDLTKMDPREFLLLILPESTKAHEFLRNLADRVN